MINKSYDKLPIYNGGSSDNFSDPDPDYPDMIDSEDTGDNRPSDYQKSLNTNNQVGFINRFTGMNSKCQQQNYFDRYKNPITLYVTNKDKRNKYQVIDGRAVPVIINNNWNKNSRGICKGGKISLYKSMASLPMPTPLLVFYTPPRTYAWENGASYLPVISIRPTTRQSIEGRICKES